MALEALLGRWVACCVHPYAAWRVLPGSGRAWLLFTYFGAAYVTVLGVLFVR